MGFSTENVQVNLKMNGVEAFKTLKDLNGHIAATRNAINKMDRTDPGYKEASGNLRNLLDQQKVWKEEVYGTKKAQNEFNKELNNSVKQQSSFMDMVKNGAAGLVAYFSIDAIIGFGKQVLETTAKFEKFRAVLGNTLGSNAIADLKLKELTEFASQTPFALDELTNSFVRLANQGFVPTRKEMRQLGDLASSTGKGFDQLAEAILDSMTGENERLKEFGIKAKVHGDMVTYTFRGVKTEVENSAEAIRNYITSLGEVEGVAGSMAVISETLTGKISNLGDSWDQMLVSVGSNTTGVFSGAMSVMSKAINAVTNYNNQLEIASKYNIGGGQWAKVAKDVGGKLFPFAKSIMDGSAAINPALKDTTNEKIKSIQDMNNALAKQATTLIETARSAKEYDVAIDKIYKEGNQKLTETGDQNLKNAIGAEYRKAILTLKDARKNFVDKDEKAPFMTESQIKALEAARKKKEAGDKKSIQEHIGLLADLQKVEEENLMNRMTANEREIAINDKKYADLTKRAKGNKEELERIEKAHSNSTLDIIEKQGEAELKKQEEIAKKAEEIFQKKATSKAAIEQQIFELGMSDDEKGQLAIDQHYETMANAAYVIGADTTAIYKAWTDATLKYNEEATLESEIAKSEMQKQMAQETANTVFGIMASNRQAQSQADVDAINQRREQEISNKNLTENQKQTINQKYDRLVAKEKRQAWLAEQKAAIAQAIINGALAMTKVAAQSGVLTFAFSPFIAAMTALQIAAIASQKAPQFAKGGQLPSGPSHANGGLSLIDPSGNKVGEIEGGEPILSRETYANNKMLVNQLLYNSQYRNGAPVSVNSALAIQGMQQYKTGGIAPSSSVSTVNNSSSPNDNSRLEGLMAQMIIAQQQANNKEVIFSTRLFDREQERMVQIRNDVNG